MGVTIVTSWTWLRGGKSLSQVDALERAEKRGVLRPRLGVKRSEKARAHVCIFP